MQWVWLKTPDLRFKQDPQTLSSPGQWYTLSLSERCRGECTGYSGNLWPACWTTLGFIYISWWSTCGDRIEHIGCDQWVADVGVRWLWARKWRDQHLVFPSLSIYCPHFCLFCHIPYWLYFWYVSHIIDLFFTLYTSIIFLIYKLLAFLLCMHIVYYTFCLLLISHCLKYYPHFVFLVSPTPCLFFLSLWKNWISSNNTANSVHSSDLSPATSGHTTDIHPKGHISRKADVNLRMRTQRN